MKHDLLIIARRKHRCNRCAERIDASDTFVRRGVVNLCRPCADNPQRGIDRRKQRNKIEQEMKFWMEGAES